MTPDLATATARARRYLTRRRFLGGVTAAGGYMAMRGIEEAAVRTVLDPLLADMEPAMPPRHLRRVLDRREFGRLAVPALLALVDAAAVNGLATVPDIAAGRLTVLEEIGSEMWIRHQGQEAARLLWRDRPRTGIRMADQPDRAFARWREQHLREAATCSEPTAELVRPIVAGRRHRYLTAVVPAAGRIYVVSADEPAATPPPALRPTPTTTGLAAA